MEFTDLISYKTLETLDNTLFIQVKTVYETVKETINSISGCFNNFTMHDIGHCVRVANYMEQLAFGIDNFRIERIKNFNAAELAIILLSALLHDIGMFIRPIDREEIKNGQIKYSDNLYFEGVLKVKNNDENEAIKEIIRLTHARRIAEFLNYQFENGQTISQILKIDNNYSYSEDIGLICQAHGENYDFIKNKLRISTTKGHYEFNQQYFAVLLRIADYLDLDRQRTPILWFSMMNIDGFSKSEWETHFLISNEKKLKSYYDGKMQIYFDGKSSNAKIHRKYLKYIDNLREELENADTLLNNKDTIEKYKLNITTKIEDLVVTDGFKYSNLRLNLDYAAITELLMGKNIYGDNRLGLRELIQNSIDACKIMKEVKASSGIGVYLPDPFISIILSKKDNYVIIKDSGIGMTLDVVKNHFLNIGKSYYKSNDYLYNNYSYNPIGQYGIGFLACFLLSDNVVVKTKHYKSNDIYQIELEKNSEYVVTNTQQAPMFYGTEIQLDYDRFFEIFKSKEELSNFISQYFFTDIPIIVKDLDKNEESKTISNMCADEMGKIISSNKKNKYELIDCSKYSKLIKGIISLCLDKSYKVSIDIIEDKNYMYECPEKKFIKTKDIPDGYYILVNYAILQEEEYHKISKTKKEPERKAKEILALAQNNGSKINLLIKNNDHFPFPRYIYRIDEEDDVELKRIFSDSKLPFYPELFFYHNSSLVFKNANNLVRLNICAYYNQSLYHSHYINTQDKRTAYLYYKDIFVRDFDPLRIALPLPYEIFGYINYLGKDIRLDVSRNEIIGGIDNLNVEFESVILKNRIEQEQNQEVKNLLQKMLNHTLSN